MNAITLITGAVLNSFWQAAILAFLVWLVLTLLQKRVNAATRHIIWWMALTAVIVLPAVPRRVRPVPERPHQPQPAPAALPVRVAPPLAQPVAEGIVKVTEERTAVWPFWVLAIWGAVLLYQIAGIVRSYIHLRRVKRGAADWPRSLHGVNRAACLLVSSEISSPIAVGFLHPAVIVPEKLRDQLTAEEMDCVVLHESAHLARYDDWVNLAARVLGAALALHPVAWWILRQIDREREVACDDWVVAQTGAPGSYAASLARVLELRMEPADSALASGIFTRRSRLRARIEMLLRRGRRFSTTAARIPVGAAALAMALLAAAGALAPHWIVFAQRLEFEVASVKRNTTNGPMDVSPRRSGNLIMMHNNQPYSMIFYAYDLNGAYQVEGYVRLPDGWNWYDVDARAPGGATDNQVRLMFQTLLADRFKLSVHRETKEIPEFELVTDKGKPRLQPSREGAMTVTIEERPYTQRPGTCGVSLWREGSHLVCHAATTETIVTSVSNLMHAPVVDRTPLTGTFDLNIRFLPDDKILDANGDPGPSLEQALQQELGLKLQKGKGPVEVLVIDHMEKPSEN